MLLSACKSTKEASVPPPNHPLELNAGWQLLEGKYTLRFEMEQGYNIRLDVNTCFGEYQKGEEGMIKFPEYASCTEMCCDSKEATDFLGQVHKANRYAIHGDTLILSGDDQKLYFLPGSEASGEEKE